MSTPVDKTLRLDRTQLGQKRPSGRPPTFLIAIVAGVAAAIVVALVLLPVFSHRTEPPAAGTAPPAPVAPVTVPVLVASGQINPRTVITDAMIKVKQVTPDKAPTNNLISSPIDAVGKVSIGVIAKDAPITSDLLTGEGISLGLAYGVSPGMRAVTIALDPVSSVAGFLKPTDHVDVVGTFTIANSKDNESVTTTILQNVLLLATGSQLLPNQTASSVNTGTGAAATADTSAAPTATVAAPIDIPNATLEVNSTDAEKLILAASKGKLQLVLRRFDDHTPTPVPAIASYLITNVHPIGMGPMESQKPESTAPPIPVPPINHQPLPPAVAVMPTITVIKGSTPATVTVGQ